MRRALILGGVATSNVLLGFVYQWYIFTQLGPGRETDALFAGMVIPNLVMAIASGSLMHVLVPLLSATDPETFRRDAWTFLQSIALLAACVAVPLMLTASFWVRLTVPGFDARALALTVHLVRVQLIGMIFTASLGVIWAVYHAQQRFIRVEISPVITAIVTFPLLVLLLPRIGVAAAAWALVAKLGLQMLILLPGMGSYRRPDFSSPAVRLAWRRLRPLLLGTSFYKTDQVVDRFLASMAPAGQLSLLHLATLLYGAGQTVLNTSIAAPMVPQLALRAHSSDWKEFRRISRYHLLQMLVLTAVALGGIILIGRPVLSAIFGHGRFHANEIRQLWILMLALAGTWIGGAAGQILSTSFYAHGDTTTPTTVGVFGYCLGIACKIGGFLLYGVVGIAVGTSFYLLFNALAMHLLLGRKLHRLVPGGELRPVAVAGER